MRGSSSNGHKRGVQIESAVPIEALAQSEQKKLVNCASLEYPRKIERLKASRLEGQNIFR